MNTLAKYDRSAPSWGEKVSRLGYLAAYDSFFAGNTVTHGCVLDVGTGDGIFARSWIKRSGSANLTLLDPSAAMLAQAKAQFAVHGIFPQMAISGLEGFQTDVKFDAVLAAHVLEHFENPDDALYHLARLLVPGGRLFLVVSKPHWCNWLIWLQFRHKWYSANSVRRMAERAGLTHLSTHTFDIGPPSRTSLGYIFTQQEGH